MQSDGLKGAQALGDARVASIMSFTREKPPMPNEPDEAERIARSASSLLQHVVAAHIRAYGDTRAKAAAEEMRERAAHIIDHWFTPMKVYPEVDQAAAIRALPLKEEPK